MDYGCIAPAAAFVRGFEEKGVPISMAQARGPMGMEKRAHIQAIADLPDVAARWQEAYGKPITDNDINEMYDAFVPLLLSSIRDYATLIPGAVQTISQLEAMRIQIAGRPLLISSIAAWHPAINHSREQSVGYSLYLMKATLSQPAAPPYENEQTNYQDK